MHDVCPHCGSQPHESRKRTFACGTTYSGSGFEYRTEACKIAEAAIKMRDEAIAQRDVAVAAQVAAEAERDAALTKAAEDRALASDAQAFLDRSMKAFRIELYEKVRVAVLDVTEEDDVTDVNYIANGFGEPSADYASTGFDLSQERAT